MASDRTGEIEAVWVTWSKGEGRCPYCIKDDEHFHSMCDCFYHEQVCEVPGCQGK